MSLVYRFLPTCSHFGAIKRDQRDGYLQISVPRTEQRTEVVEPRLSGGVRTFLLFFLSFFFSPPASLDPAIALCSFLFFVGLPCSWLQRLVMQPASIDEMTALSLGLSSTTATSLSLHPLFSSSPPLPCQPSTPASIYGKCLDDDCNATHHDKKKKRARQKFSVRLVCVSRAAYLPAPPASPLLQID